MYEKSVILISMIWDYLTEVIREVILRLVRSTVPGKWEIFLWDKSVDWLYMTVL